MQWMTLVGAAGDALALVAAVMEFAAAVVAHRGRHAARRRSDVGPEASRKV